MTHELGGQTAELLDEVQALIAKFVVLPSGHAGTVLSLFALHTWALDAAAATPYLLVLSAEKQSGKSRLVEVLRFVVRDPCHAASGSEAALFQIIGAKRPTLILDETDAIFGVRSDRTEGLRGILNAGNRPGAAALRGGKDGTPQEYQVFCPKVLCGIDTGRLPDTIVDRGIVIRMRRRAPGEVLPRFREHKVDAETELLREKLREWAEAAVSVLRDTEPELPDELPDRAADSWEPLLAIADLAGDDFGSRARAAAVALNGPTDEDEPMSLGTKLLAATQRAFGDAERLSSADLRERINKDEDAPFGRFNDGAGLDPLGVADLLRPYEIRPKQMRFGDRTLKGYEARMFRDAWQRYLGSTPEQPAIPETKTPDNHYVVSNVSNVSRYVPETTDRLFENAQTSPRDNPETSETTCPF